MLLLLIAIDMLRTAPSTARITAPEVEAGPAKDDVAIVPLAMPLLAGPGSIATVIVLMGRVQPKQWWNGLPVLVAIAAGARRHLPDARRGRPASSGCSPGPG